MCGHISNLFKYCNYGRIFILFLCIRFQKYQVHTHNQNLIFLLKSTLSARYRETELLSAMHFQLFYCSGSEDSVDLVFIRLSFSTLSAKLLSSMMALKLLIVHLPLKSQSSIFFRPQGCYICRNFCW